MHLIANKTSGVVWFHNALNGKREELAPNGFGIVSELEIPRIRDLEGVEIVKELTAEDVLRSLQGQTKNNYPAPLVTRGKVLFLWDKEPESFLLWAYHVAAGLANSGYAVHILNKLGEIPGFAKDYKISGLLTWERNRNSIYGSFDYIIAFPSTLAEARILSTSEGIPFGLLADSETTQEASFYITPSTEAKSRLEKLGLENVKIVRSFVSEGASFINERSEDYIVAIGEDAIGFFKQLRNVEEGFPVHYYGKGSIQSDARHPVVASSLQDTKSRLKWLAKAKAVFALSYQPIDFLIREALAVGTPVFAPNLSEFEQEFQDKIVYFTNPIKILKQINGAPRQRQAGFVGWNADISMKGRKERSLLTGSSSMIFWGPLIDKGGGISYIIQMMREASAQGFSVSYIGSRGSRKFVEEHSKDFDPLYLEFTDEELVLQYIENSQASLLVVDSYHVLNIPTRILDSIPTVVVWQYWVPFLNRVSNIDQFRLNEIDERATRQQHLWRGLIVNSSVMENLAQKAFGDQPIWKIIPPLPKLKKRKGRTAKRTHILIPLLEDTPQQAEFMYKLASLLKEKFLILDIRGGDKYTKNLAKLGNVEVLKGVSNPESYYRKAKVVIVPTFVAHTFCMQAAEALIEGAPVIALKDGNLPNLVNKGGILAKGDSPEEWAAAIETILGCSKQYEDGAKEDAQELSKLTSFSFEKLMGEVFPKTDTKLALVANKNIPGGWRMFRELEKILPAAKINGPGAKTLYYNEFYLRRKLQEGDAAVFASSPLQVELDNEFTQLDSALTHKNNILVCPSEAMSEFFNAKGLSAVHIPVPAPTPSTSPTVKYQKDHVALPYWQGVGRKNIFATLVALTSFENLTIHITEKAFGAWASYFQDILNLTRFPLLSDSSYFELIQSMEFGLYLSIGETFNQAAFEALYLGVPSLITESAAFAKSLPDSLKQILVVHNVEDISEIRERINVLRKTREELSGEIVVWAARFAQKHNKMVQEKYQRTFGG